jgi:ADP-ribose pyrophosphatase
VSDDGLEILGRETVYRGFFRVDRFRIRHRLYAGGWTAPMDREMFERGRTVALLLYDPDADAVVLVEQVRLAAHLVGLPAWQTEVVAGIVADDDPSEDAVARREAQEEAGVTVEGPLVPIHRFMPSPGGSTETIDLFCGRVDAKGAGGTHGLAEEHEDTKVVVLSYREAMRRLRAGEIISSPTMLSLYWLAANRARLRRAWPA